MLDFITGSDPYIWKGYFLAVIFLVFNLSKTALNNMFVKYGFSAALRMRTAITSAIYRKVSLGFSLLIFIIVAHRAVILVESRFLLNNCAISCMHGENMKVRCKPCEVNLNTKKLQKHTNCNFDML